MPPHPIHTLRANLETERRKLVEKLAGCALSAGMLEQLSIFQAAKGRALPSSAGNIRLDPYIAPQIRGLATGVPAFRRASEFPLYAVPAAPDDVDLHR